MWTRDFLIVWIPVRLAPEIEPNQDENFTGSVLIRALPKDNSAPGYIEQESLTLVRRLQRDLNWVVTRGWEIVLFIIDTVLLKSD